MFGDTVIICNNMFLQPHQIFSFPARLSLPKGQQQGFPLQFLVVISSPNPLNVPYGPVVPEQSLTYQNQQYQVVSVEQYEQLKQQAQISQMGGGIQQNVEVLPENLANAQQQVQGTLSIITKRVHTLSVLIYATPSSQLLETTTLIFTPNTTDNTRTRKSRILWAKDKT